MALDKKRQKVLNLNVDRLQLYKKVFGSEDGQRILYDLCKNNFILRPTHVPQDEASTWKNEGRRECVLHILEMVNKDEKTFTEMIKRQMGIDAKYNELE